MISMTYPQRPREDGQEEEKVYRIRFYRVIKDDEGRPRSRKRVTVVRTDDSKLTTSSINTEHQAKVLAGDLTEVPRDRIIDTEVCKAIEMAKHKNGVLTYELEEVDVE